MTMRRQVTQDRSSPRCFPSMLRRACGNKIRAPCNLFVYHCPPTWQTDEDIRNFFNAFAPFGQIVSGILAKDQTTGVAMLHTHAIYAEPYVHACRYSSKCLDEGFPTDVARLFPHTNRNVLRLKQLGGNFSHESETHFGRKQPRTRLRKSSLGVRRLARCLAKACLSEMPVSVLFGNRPSRESGC